ncbi:MAG: hypothetical protein FWG99_07505 [Treponema sp.]|nr:hypothetical protein [Treponema sp.]
MIETLFFLRFKSQLRRTRPDLVHLIEQTMLGAIADAGGKLTGERMLTASYNEDSIGFWLDMLILIENVKKCIDAEPDLYGYALVVSKVTQQPEADNSPLRLCRFFAGGGGGVFLDKAAAEGLSPFVLAETPQEWLKQRTLSTERHNGIDQFFRLKELRDFNSAVKADTAFQEGISHALGRDSKRNTLVLSPVLSNMSDCLHQYCRDVNGDFPSLILCFDNGGFKAVVDVFSPELRSFFERRAELLRKRNLALEEITGLWELLFRERLRDEISVFISRKARRFFSLLLEFYSGVARKQGHVPILALENIHHADKATVDMLFDIFSCSKNTIKDFLILGTSSDSLSDDDFYRWRRIFQKIIRPEFKKENNNGIPDMPLDLWEIAYTILLLSRYYPAVFISRLFGEEGKKNAVITRALSLLSMLGVIYSPQDPRLCMDNFSEHAQKALGEKAAPIKAFVCRRLLDWVKQQKLKPCFNLLLIISDLGAVSQLDDRLILSSIISDLLNETSSSVEAASKSGLLRKISGSKRAAIILFIYNTMRALHFGSEDEIRAMFKEPAPECSSFPILKSQVHANLSSYYLGQRDSAAAQDNVKQAIILSQDKNNLCLPQSYRLFSMVNLCKQQFGESIDYLDFSMANAEKHGNYNELGISAYYASVSQFLYGNLSKAAVLARKAGEECIDAGRPDWADRSRFFEGRLAFETGNYGEAVKIFEALLRSPVNGKSPEKDRLLAAWAYRAKIYHKSSFIPKPDTGGNDADLFEVEASYLAGDYRKCAELSAALKNPYLDDNFLFTEQPHWRSGFSQCELLYFSRGENWDRMVSVFHSLAICRLSAEGGEEAVQTMQRILRNERLSEMDPWDAFYFYAWYKILEQTRTNQADMSTAVSSAFKRLQRRAGRIDNVEIRRQYLNKPRWNNALCQAAKEFKLI